MLSQLLSSLNLSLSFNAAITTCTCTGFWGQCRLGKLLPISTSVSSPVSLLLYFGFKRSIQNPQSCILYPPHTKTHPHGEEAVLIDQNDPVNSITLLKNHICVNSIPKDGLLFSFKKSGCLAVMDKTSFLQCCNDIWRPLGHLRLTGHSF
jgi:hypothetical protein